MDTITILQLTGFAASFILLFVFIAKYHAALEDEQDLEDEVAGMSETTVSAAPTFTPRASLLQTAQSPAALELADLKEQVKTLYYRLEELTAANQKHQADVAAQLARLETRVGTFEQEYVNKLQPTLLRVIDELEHIKGGEPARSATQAVGSQEDLFEPGKSATDSADDLFEPAGQETAAPVPAPNPATPQTAPDGQSATSDSDTFTGRNPLVPELPEEELKF